ncbi:hypothetical protein HYZ97_01200 [Candidatus Pacearchaeota archaeon]|nr:hypothetical protein [Candidatus Pacearchaeota archaeon]
MSAKKSIPEERTLNTIIEGTYREYRQWSELHFKLTHVTIPAKSTLIRDFQHDYVLYAYLPGLIGFEKVQNINEIVFNAPQPLYSCHGFIISDYGSGSSNPSFLGEPRMVLHHEQDSTRLFLERSLLHSSEESARKYREEMLQVLELMKSMFINPEYNSYYRIIQEGRKERSKEKANA